MDYYEVKVLYCINIVSLSLSEWAVIWEVACLDSISDMNSPRWPLATFPSLVPICKMGVTGLLQILQQLHMWNALNTKVLCKCKLIFFFILEQKNSYPQWNHDPGTKSTDLTIPHQAMPSVLVGRFLSFLQPLLWMNIIQTVLLLILPWEVSFLNFLELIVVCQDVSLAFLCISTPRLAKKRLCTHQPTEE